MRYVLTVPESVTAPFVIPGSDFTSKVSDADETAEHKKYTFSMEKTDAPFSINANTGELTLLKDVDYDTMLGNSFTFDIWTEQSSTNFAGSLASKHVQVEVVITNANDL